MNQNGCRIVVLFVLPFPSIMLTVVATAAALSLLPSFVAGQTASCLSGYDWVCAYLFIIEHNLTNVQQSFNSDGKSPCDVAAALGGVCAGGGELIGVHILENIADTLL